MADLRAVSFPPSGIHRPVQQLVLPQLLPEPLPCLVSLSWPFSLPFSALLSQPCFWLLLPPCKARLVKQQHMRLCCVFCITLFVQAQPLVFCDLVTLSLSKRWKSTLKHVLSKIFQTGEYYQSTSILASNWAGLWANDNSMSETSSPHLSHLWQKLVLKIAHGLGTKYSVGAQMDTSHHVTAEMLWCSVSQVNLSRFLDLSMTPVKCALVWLHSLQSPQYYRGAGLILPTPH